MATPIMAQNKRVFGLLCRRECVVPTLRGWLLLLLGFAAVILVIMRGIHPFLAVTDPTPGGVLVVEGWAPDHALKAAVVEFNHNHYEKVYVTGGPLIWGAPLSEYKTYAEGGAASLVKLGLSSNVVEAVPTKWVLRDRTYA